MTAPPLSPPRPADRDWSAPRRPAWTPASRRRLRPPVGIGPHADGARHGSTLAERRVRIALTIATVCGVGYLTLGRPFAYLGITPANVFIGEICLVSSMIYVETRQLWRQVPAMLQKAGPFHVIAWAVVAQLSWGIIEAGRGIVVGHSVLYVLKNLPFNYLPLFLIPGLWAGSRDPALLRRILVAAAWVDATYGLLQVTLLSNLTTSLPGTNVALFDLAPTSGLLIVCMLGMTPRPRFFSVLVAVNAFVMLAHQVRAEWTAFAAALLVWLLLTRRIRVAVVGLVAVVGVLGFISLSGLNVSGRGGTVSFAGVTARVIAPFAPDEAAKLLGTTKAQQFAGTAQWRTDWWHGIDASARSSPVLSLAGHGYGFQLSSLTLSPQGVPNDVRTPHDVYYYALGYTGRVGVVIFFTLLLTLAAALWKVWRTTGVATGLLVIVFMLGVGLFGDWWETPFGGVPAYLLIGIALAPLVTPPRSPEPAVQTEPEIADGAPVEESEAAGSAAVPLLGRRLVGTPPTAT